MTESRTIDLILDLHKSIWQNARPHRANENCTAIRYIKGGVNFLCNLFLLLYKSSSVATVCNEVDLNLVFCKLIDAVYMHFDV